MFFFIRRINVQRHMYKVQQKDYYFSHVPWLCDPVVTPNNQWRNDAERCQRDAAVVLLMRPVVLIHQLTEELGNGELD